MPSWVSGLVSDSLPKAPSTFSLEKISSPMGLFPRGALQITTIETSLGPTTFRAVFAITRGHASSTWSTSYFSWWHWPLTYFNRKLRRLCQSSLEKDRDDCLKLCSSSEGRSPPSPPPPSSKSSSPPPTPSKSSKDLATQVPGHLPRPARLPHHLDHPQRGHHHHGRDIHLHTAGGWGRAGEEKDKSHWALKARMIEIWIKHHEDL